MPKRGRKPKPNHLHVVDGTRRPEHGKPQAASKQSLPDPPEHLGELAREFYVGVSRDLRALGIADEADRHDVETASLLYERARLAERHIPEGGYYICDRTNNPKRHPAAVEAMQARKELRILLEAMGLSQAGRARLGVARDKGEEDPAERFFGAS